jgi:hypothetical protein
MKRIRLDYLMEPAPATNLAPGDTVLASGQVNGAYAHARLVNRVLSIFEKEPLTWSLSDCTLLAFPYPSVCTRGGSLSLMGGPQIWPGRNRAMGPNANRIARRLARSSQTRGAFIDQRTD